MTKSNLVRALKIKAMNPIAIVSAMHDELSQLLALMPDEHKQTRAGREFWAGHLYGHEVVLVLSGIGKVAAATTAALLIEHFKVSKIVFTGVAGGLKSKVNVGDLVVADSFLQHDLDVSPLFPKYQVPSYGVDTFQADESLAHELRRACAAVLNDLTSVLTTQTRAAFNLASPQLHQGLLISGDRFVSTTAESQKLQQDLPQALAVEMESAAFAQVCHDYDVPFAAVRTISDRADDGATVDFNRFLSEVASLYSAAIVDKWLKNKKN
jgi:adenosylhomocysteine nucleosidase